MAREPGDRTGTSVVIVEDQLHMAKVMERKLRTIRGPQGEIVTEVKIIDPNDFFDATLGRVDVAFVDAYRHENGMFRDPNLPKFAGLWVAHSLSTLRPTPRIIGYSARAEYPEVNIPFRDVWGVSAVYTEFNLVDHLAEALWSEDCVHQVHLPTSDDYAELGLLPGADVFRALRMARASEEAWATVAAGGAGSQAVRRLFRDHIAEALPMPGPVRFRPMSKVLARVAIFNQQHGPQHPGDP